MKFKFAWWQPATLLFIFFWAILIFIFNWAVPWFVHIILLAIPLSAIIDDFNKWREARLK